MQRRLTDSEVELAREWLLDCFSDDDSQDAIREATPEEIERGVARHWDGGLDDFTQVCRLAPKVIGGVS